ncbi:hypothetical protein D5F01_LYC07985 [Larimichthys crocea]|uniref:Uncharacterized protein n=2 Tax=Larimichthys crocea TaxID=215358 RepID=A0ACD3RB50_LARCR|nr:hypothetical protein D5F01_LYC07985 [Larimichthys crocea]TMS16635.1 hypothetical protein E3U43_013928 [Larimichthys crocea]
MSQKVLLFKLLLVRYATQSLAEIRANCNEDVTLDCPGLPSGDMNFLSLTWYKLSEKRHGIIRFSKNGMSPQNYSFIRPARFGERYSLFLTSVTPEDSGSYECAISANVGGQNQNLQVNLIVHECVTEADLTTKANVLNATQPNRIYVQPEDLPLMWAIIGYVAVAIGKMVLSLISIWVIRAVHKRSSRRWRDEC